MKRALVVCVAILSGCLADPPRRGVLLEDLTWDAAERVLTPDAVVVIALGAASKEHGFHLPLNNDLILAEYLKARVLERADVVVAPTIGHSYFPKFVEYPGSISLSLETARDLVVEAVRSLARFGPKRFYVVNTGVSTRHALGPASETLALEGIALRWTNLLPVLAPLESAIAQKPRGSHADEIETSIMLYIAPEIVDMSRAVRECAESADGPLVRTPREGCTLSPSGCWGDPTLATRAKGKFVMDGWAEAVLREIEVTRALRPPFEPQRNR